MARGAVAIPAAMLLSITFQGCGGGPPDRGISDALPDQTVSTTILTTVAPDGHPASSGVSQPSFTAPAKIATGQLSGLVGHRGSGEAAIWRQPDGALIVRLERFEVSNVGGLSVYLMQGRGIDKPDGGVRLAGLASNTGTVNLPIPAGTGVSQPLTVLIWSDASRLPVANATEMPL